jgi:hypothetical protein
MSGAEGAGTERLGRCKRFLRAELSISVLGAATLYFLKDVSPARLYGRGAADVQKRALSVTALGTGLGSSRPSI